MWAPNPLSPFLLFALIPSATFTSSMNPLELSQAKTQYDLWMDRKAAEYSKLREGIRRVCARTNLHVAIRDAGNLMVDPRHGLAYCRMAKVRLKLQVLLLPAYKLCVNYGVVKYRTIVHFLVILGWKFDLA